MSDAAHPQPDREPVVDSEPVPVPEDLTVKNPFPAQVSVPGPDGELVEVELAVVDGVLYAPLLDQSPLAPVVRQYVTDFCAAWSMSQVTTGRLAQSVQERPRRAQVVFEETQFHAMLGLAGDERLLRVDVDQVSGRVRFIVESPRLPQQPYWNGGPPIVTLPIAAFYEGRTPAAMP